MSDVESESMSSDESTDSEDVQVTKVLDWEIDVDGRLLYLCKCLGSDEPELYDRSDLIDFGANQRLVLQFERTHNIPWDPMCPYCDEEGCEECVCPDCERPCRFLKGVNYGCEKHPVV